MSLNLAELTAKFLQAMLDSAEFSGSSKYAGDDLNWCKGASLWIFAVLDGVNEGRLIFNIMCDATNVAARPEVSEFAPFVIDWYLKEGLPTAVPNRATARANRTMTRIGALPAIEAKLFLRAPQHPWASGLRDLGDCRRSGHGRADPGCTPPTICGTVAPMVYRYRMAALVLTGAPT